MEKDDSPTRRKVRFTPKAPSRRKPKSVPLKTEAGDDDDDGTAEAQTLLRQFNANLRRRGPKAGKKTQVAFGPGATTSSSTIRSFGVPKNGGSKSSSSCLDLKSSDDEEILSLLPFKKDETDVSFEDATDASTLIGKNEYIEPWDYHHNYYPTVLPLRRPYSGDPEILDAAEFGEAAINEEYDENATNPAQELGLKEENEEENMLLFQLPPTLPLVKRSASVKGKEKVGSSTSSNGTGAPAKGGRLEALSSGYVGKMQVYKSGAIKLKLGDVLYDVSPGVNCTFAEDIVAINTKEKQCCVLGELSKRAVMNPDINSLVNSVIDLG